MAGILRAEGDPLKCDIGPVQKTYASVSWLVYSCDDFKSLVVVSAPGSPAAPFYFFFTLNGTEYRLSGEGAGAKAVTDAAFAELRQLRKADIESLLAETRSATLLGSRR